MQNSPHTNPLPKREGTISGFTLVELIVVITILAILGTIAFISFQGYSKSARDSKRVSDVNNIETSLELFMLQTGKYPLPDNAESVTYSGGTITVWDQGTVGDTVSTQLSRNLTQKPLDPLFETEYTYSTTPSRKEYEIMSLYEGNLALNNIKQANAATSVTVKVDGTYNGVYVRTGDYIIPTPSIITSLDPTSLDFNATTIESQVIDGGNNVPDVGNINVTQSTGALTFGTLEVYNGALNKNTSDTEWINAYDAVANTYNGSSLVSDTTVQVLLSKNTDEEKIAFTQTIVLDTKEALAASNTQSQGPTLTGWRAQDSNCGIEDIPLGSQIWAGCNSTLGTGLEYTDESNCYNYDKDGNGSIDNLGVSAGCGVGNYGDSNDNAKDYYDSLAGTINQNNDEEISNIWGKLYTWDSLDTDADNDIDANDTNLVCGEGYHIPSDAEWTTLENYLNGSSCRTGDGWQCDGLGWKNHNTKTNTNNIANALKLVLGGVYMGGYYNRGYDLFLWTSTSVTTKAYYRNLDWKNSTILRNSFNQDSGFFVRCIKD